MLHYSYFCTSSLFLEYLFSTLRFSITLTLVNAFCFFLGFEPIQKLYLYKGIPKLKSLVHQIYLLYYTLYVCYPDIL